jgi:hypothetical protein
MRFTKRLAPTPIGIYISIGGTSLPRRASEIVDLGAYAQAGAAPRLAMPCKPGDDAHQNLALENTGRETQDTRERNSAPNTSNSRAHAPREASRGELWDMKLPERPDCRI